MRNCMRMDEEVTFDLTSADMAGPQFWEAVGELRRHGPLTWVESHGGFWAATSYDVVHWLAQDWPAFTSTQGVSITRPGFDVMPRLVPIELDPPRQQAYRTQVDRHL